MRVLVLGGTRFLGRALVDATLEQGHEPTLFNRGQTEPTLFPRWRSCAATAPPTSRRSGARMGRGARRRGVHAGRGPARRRGVAGQRRPLRVRLERLGLRGPERAAGGEVQPWPSCPRETRPTKAPKRTARGRRRASGSSAKRSATPRSSYVRVSSSARTTRRAVSRTGPTASHAAGTCSRRRRQTTPYSSSTCAILPGGS